jgi:hypothetical protein
VARFDTDTLDEVIDVCDLFYADRLPGSALPRMRRDGATLTITRYAGTGHEQTQHVRADPAGRFILGPDVWPWILSGQAVPDHAAADRSDPAVDLTGRVRHRPPRPGRGAAAADLRRPGPAASRPARGHRPRRPGSPRRGTCGCPRRDTP